MAGQIFQKYLLSQARPLAVVLGTNEIASAVAVCLVWDGYNVVLSHDPTPPVIRRKMAFCDALFDDRAEVDGIVGSRVDTRLDLLEVFGKPGRVAVTTRHLSDLIAMCKIDVLIDGRMQKTQITPNLRGLTRIAIGLGPNFKTSANCDIAIETHPAMTGAIVKNGATKAKDSVSRNLGRAGKERFVYTGRDGLWFSPLEIGARLFKGVLIGRHDGIPIHAPIDGYLRGVVRDGSFVPAGVKLLEIDPRGRAATWEGADELGRTIGQAVVNAIDAYVSQSAVGLMTSVDK